MTARDAPNDTGAPAARTLRALGGFGGRAAAATLRPLVDVTALAVKTGLKLERRSRAALTDAAHLAVGAGLDAALASRYADDVLRRVLAGPVTERAVGVALEGPLVDAIARDLAHYAVLDRVMTHMLDAGAFEDMLRGDAVERMLDGAELERLVSSAFENARVLTVLTKALESHGADQVVAAIFESRLFDEVVNRLLASDALWRLVEEIADSPAVTAAIAQQGVGFIGEIGEEVRRRSRGADVWLELKARRAARRRPKAVSPDDGGVPAGEAP